MYYLVGYVDNEKPNAILNDEIDEIKMWSEGGRITSRSRGYDTLEDLKEGEGILEQPCVICGGVAGTKYMDNLTQIVRNMCFSCNFWTERVLQHKDNENVFIIEGQWYTDGGRKDNPKYPQHLGFGGSEFKIQTNDGRIVSTNNLWFGGKIPKYFLSQLPDNAKSLKS